MILELILWLQYNNFMGLFYGIKAEQPTLEIAMAFGSDQEPVRLDGGQGTSYLSGDIVLKPHGKSTSGRKEWVAELFAGLPDSQKVRFPRPIKSILDTWDYKGYVAWTYLKGKNQKGCYKEKLEASIEFHKLLASVPKPDFLSSPRGSWSTANWVALDQKEFNYDLEFLNLYKQIKPHLKSLPESRQIVHADLGGNFIFQLGTPPGIIDFTPLWAPNGFGEGVMLADALVWENAKPEELVPFKQIPNIEQFAWRGTLTRIVEQAEHIKWFDKDKSEAIKEAQEFQKAIDYLEKEFN